MDQEVVIEIVAALNRLTAAVAVLATVVMIFIISIYIVIWKKDGRGMPGVPDPLKIDSKKADELFDRGKVDQLVDYAGSCVDKYPNDIEARWYLGLAYFSMGQFHSALEQFNEIIRLNPSWKEHPVGPYLDEIEAQLSTLPSGEDKH